MLTWNALFAPQKKVESPKPKQRVDKVVAEVSKLKDVSPLEQLERTMPAVRLLPSLRIVSHTCLRAVAD